MVSKILNNLKALVIIAIIVAFVWFLAVYPTYKFKQYESQVKEAAERYYEINSTKLPTGNRVSTVTLQELFTGSYLKEDLYIPYTKKPCSPVNSWVKVAKKDAENYHYYIYLECGAIKSNVDHKGPQITLKGDEEMTIEVDSDFEDPGIAKIYDKKDGKINVSEAIVKDNVNPEEPGEYEITYTAADKFGNKTTVVRKVKVINTLSTQVKKELGKAKRFTGDPENNYIKVSNITFRIVGLDGNNNVIVTTEHPISYVNYNKIDKWLNDYFYNLLSEDTKKLIVESSYCKTVSDYSSKTCSKKTEKKKLYYPSIVDINLAQGSESNFMFPEYVTWVNAKANEVTTASAVNRDFNGNAFVIKGKTDIAAISPMLTINGKEIIHEGDGTFYKPFKLRDYKNMEGDREVKDLSIGDIIYNKGVHYVVIDKPKDGAAKVISYSSITNYEELVSITNEETDAKSFIYNPNKKKNVGYNINNQLTKYIDKTIFKSHDIEVPIYKDKIIYGEEIKKTKYKVLFSAPNIFEIYSTHPFFDGHYEGSSCWFINSSTAPDVGVSLDSYGYVGDTVYTDDTHQVRIVAYIDSKQNVSGGDGSYENPYIVR